MDREKTKKAVDKLIKLTSDGKLTWESVGDEPNLKHGVPAIIRQVFSTEYDEKKFVVYEYSYKDLDEAENVYWNSEIAFEMVDDQYHRLVTFPRTLKSMGLI